MPEQGVLVVQDVACHHTHLWFPDKDFDGRQTHIDRFAAETEYDTILPGHGEPTGPAIWARAGRPARGPQACQGQMDFSCHACMWSRVAVPPSAKASTPVLEGSGKIWSVRVTCSPRVFWA